MAQSRDAGGRFTSGGVELATAYVTLKADGRRLPGEAAALGAQSGKAYGAGFSRSNKAAQRVVEGIGRTSKRVFLAGAAGIAFAEKKAADYNAQMATVFTLSHANTRQQEQLAKAAKTVGVNIGYSATKTGQAEEELIKAGVSVRDMMTGGLKGALDLAAAGQTDVASATEVAASAMTQFSLKGSQVPHIADLLAAGADKALGSVTDLGYGLSQAGTTAHQMNLSIEDTVGTLAEFAQNGLIGERAGTTLKMMLLRLANPTEKSGKLMDKYGLSIYKANGQLKSMPEIAGQLQKSFKDLAPAERNAALGTIFGSRAIQAANILIKDGEAGNRKWIASVDDQGFAAHQAAGKMDSLRGDAQKLNAELENAFINASGKQSFLRMLAQDASKLLRGYNKLSAAQREMINRGAVKVVAGAGLLVVATKVYKLAKSTSALYGALFKTSAGSTALKAVGKGLGGKAGVTPVYVTNWGGAGGLAGKGAAASAAGSAAGSGLGGALGGGVAGAVLGKAAPNLFKVWADFQERAFLQTALKNVAPRVGGAAALMALGDAGNEVTKPGQHRGGVLPSWLPGSSGQKSSKSTLLSPDMLTDADIAKLSKAEKATLGLGDAAKGSSKWWTTFADGVTKAITTAGKYSETLSTVPKDIRSYVSTPGAVNSLDEMRRIAKQYHLTPKQIRTIMQLQGFSQTQGRIAAAGKAFKQLPKDVRTKLAANTVKSMIDVKALQKRYHLTPAQVRTVVNVAGIPEAIAKARALQREIAAIKSKSVTISIHRANHVTGPSVGAYAPDAEASGGTIAGRRTPYGDKVLTFLAPGEEVISNRYGQADKHRGLLKAINSNRMAGGGSVGRTRAASTDGGGGPINLTLVDHDGVLIGTMTGVADERYYANGALASQ